VIERLSTHVLDTTRGRPAAGIAVQLLSAAGDELGRGVTDADGRVPQLNERPFPAGDVRLVFETEPYFGAKCFYPRITVQVRLDGARPHYHVPVLASTFSYSTYLGS
jgi:5-hydroxyisourate hydrolase